MTKSFRKFLEEEKYPFIKSLGDVFNVRPEDLEKEVQVGTFFQMGAGTNRGSYKIVGYKRNGEGKITHAVVKMISLDKTYKDKGGEFLEIPPQNLSQEKLVPIEDLDGLLRQDFEPQAPPPA